MLKLSTIKDWLKVIYDDAEHYYIGRLENKKEKSLGVYSLERTKDIPLFCLGGKDQNATRVKDVSILLHWNKNADETEEAAMELFETLLNLDGQSVTIGTTNVYFIELLVSEPIDVGTDNSIYERVIEVRFYYE